MTKRLLILAILFLVNVPVFAQSVHGESVDTAWVRRYHVAEYYSDEAKAIAIDRSGNIYVTGYCSHVNVPLRHGDYGTVKYYPNGDTAWVRRYDGEILTFDDAYDIAVDDSGNVYVTGISEGSGYYYDYATIKYYPDGDTAWVRRYNGPANGQDWAYAIAVDDAGNVYVTGSSGTIKYDSNGTQLWVDTLFSGSAIAVDDSNNVYITGGVTVKYDANGNQLWVGQWGGVDVALDIFGNAYVTGDGYLTIKYYPGGDTAWVRRYDGPGDSEWSAAIAVDESGNVYVTGSNWYSGTEEGSYITVKYYSDGTACWVREFGGAGPPSFAYNIALDDSCNVYVTGLYAFTYYGTVRYYPNGDIAWEKQEYGFCGRAYAIAADDSGNVYVTGYSSTVETGDDYTTIKYVQFLCGDVNKDGVVNSADIIYLINYLFKNGPAPMPILKTGDASCDGVVDVGDVVYLINYLFKNGPDPCC